MQAFGEPARPGTVYLAGAGPGDPGLLTLRAARLLQTATLILPDDLVSAEVLGMANSDAKVIPVGKRCGDARITQAGINGLMVGAAREGKSVLRLKSGDPLVFGRVGEELEALRVADVPVEVVPGISAAFAAAARLRTPLTDRASASKLILMTGHHAAEKRPTDSAPLWSGPLPEDATLVVYMPGRNFEGLAAELIAGGISPEMPCVALSQATRPTERIHGTTLGHLENTSIGPAPVLLLIGEAIRTRQ